MSVADSFPAWVNGRMVAPSEPAISSFDQGFQLGMAVFDTVVLQDGCRYFEQQHIARLEIGARMLGIVWPLPWEPACALEEYSRAIEQRDSALRLTLSRGVPGEGPTLCVNGRVLELPPRPGVIVSLEHDAKIATHDLETIKNTNRLRNLMARERAHTRGAWEALLCTVDGDVVEGTISNLFVVEGGGLRTPSVDRGCLPGIMRALVLEAAERAGLATTIERVEIEHLRSADEIFLTNTTGRVIPVLQVIDVVRDLPAEDGPLTRRMRELIRGVEERYRTDHRAGAL